MANLFNYKNRAGYTAATDRPAQQSSVSYDGSVSIYDGKNVILPFLECNCEVGDMVVYDSIESKRKILKSKTYHAGSFDSSRYILGRGVYFLSQNGKGVFVALENAISSSQMWAEKCYYRLTGLDLTVAGSITFKTYYSWAAHAGNVVSWEGGATLASVVATINGLGLSASYFKAAVLADNTGIGIWVNYPTTDNVSNIFSITASSGGGAGATVTYQNKYNDANVVWQYVATSTIISGRKPAKSVVRRNGLVTYWGGGHYEKFLAYYADNGSATYVAESSADPMKRTAFVACGSSSVAEELALYNKYNGSYEAYIKGAMVLADSAREVMGVSYDDNKEQTKLLAEVMTKDYDNNVIPAFPAAYYAYHYGVNAGVTTGFEAGNWGLMTAYQMMKLMEVCGLNSSNKKDFNTQFAKYNDAGNIYGNGQYYWTCAECSAYSSFIYNGYGGVLGDDSKDDTLSCRAALALDFD